MKWRAVGLIYVSMNQMVVVFLIWIGFFLSQTSADGAKQKLLFVGDSHTVGLFGEKLESLLREKYQVSRVAASGASTYSYLDDGPKLVGTPLMVSVSKPCYSTTWGFIWTNYDGTIKDKSINSKELKQAPCFREIIIPNPDLLVVALGSNQLGYPGAQARKHIEDFMKLVPKKLDCVWIAPPSMRKADPKLIESFYQKVLTAADLCKVFKSFDSKVTKYDPVAGDGIHYWDRDKADHWAEEASRCILGGTSDICISPRKTNKKSTKNTKSKF